MCESRRFKSVVVDMPVSVPCSGVTIAKPDFAFQHVATSDDVLSKTKAALEELDQRKAYEAELEARQAGCE